MMKKGFLCLLFCSCFLLLISCHRGVTIHPSKITPDMKREYASGICGLYDMQVRFLSSIHVDRQDVTDEEGKQKESIENQDSTFNLQATFLDYDNGMKLIVHNFPISTLAASLPDTLSSLRKAIAALPDQELTIDYDFGYDAGDEIYMVLNPQELSFSCQTDDGQQHNLRLRFDTSTNWIIGAFGDRTATVDLVLDQRVVSFSARTLYEDNDELFHFDEWGHDDFYYTFLRVVGRS